ncbi:MAG: DUF1844 domain-containing protein [Candidatus Eremiobacteraeota bacterium]|nr:DUF1844 domain-containing protein [Candidatus Eremiobacteraeota bacterium]
MNKKIEVITMEENEKAKDLGPADKIDSSVKKEGYGPYDSAETEDVKTQEIPEPTSEKKEKPASEEPSQGKKEEPTPEEPLQKEKIAAMIPRDVFDTLRAMYSLLASQAWIFMGFVMNPVEGKITKDITQARLAIDTIDFMYPRLEPNLDDREKREMKNILDNLKLNFIQVSSESRNK